MIEISLFLKKILDYITNLIIVKSSSGGNFRSQSDTTRRNFAQEINQIRLSSRIFLEWIFYFQHTKNFHGHSSHKTRLLHVFFGESFIPLNLSAEYVLIKWENKVSFSIFFQKIYRTNILDDTWNKRIDDMKQRNKSTFKITNFRSNIGTYIRIFIAHQHLDAREILIIIFHIHEFYHIRKRSMNFT